MNTRQKVNCDNVGLCRCIITGQKGNHDEAMLLGYVNTRQREAIVIMLGCVNTRQKGNRRKFRLWRCSEFEYTQIITSLFYFVITAV